MTPQLSWRAFSLLVALTFPVALSAQVTQTWGAGSAVTTLSAGASFENTSALFDNPYVENGLSFTRTGLSFNNNGCGSAGCFGAPGLDPLVGNYMYGVGSGFFSMFSPTGQRFFGLEFLVGDGYGSPSLWSISWTALLGGSPVGTGSVASFTAGSTIGFSSITGFDELRYTDLNSTNAPAFDEVRAQLGASDVVPEPATMTLLATGLAGMVGAGVRRRKKA